MKTAGKKFTYTKKPTKISKFEIFILKPDTMLHCTLLLLFGTSCQLLFQA
jgi:hypothetical protein